MYDGTHIMSEEMLQISAVPIGEYLYYKLGATTINQLYELGYVNNVDITDIKDKKPDGMILKNKEIVCIIEYKQQLRNQQDIDKAIIQEINVAQKLSKIFVITDGQKTIWLNSKTGNKITDQGSDLTFILDVKKFNDLDYKNEFILLINKILDCISTDNDELRRKKIIDPTPLAKKLWQTIWVATQKQPVQCLYNVVELFIFKFLSDLNILDKEYSFDKIYQLSQRKDYEFALNHYATNTRKEIIKKFPKSAEDDTTIINGTIFVNENGEPNLSQSLLFKKTLEHLFDYQVKFGTFVEIDKSFKTKLYETFLTQEVEAMGQYFTPRKIIQSIIKISGIDQLKDIANKRIIDPFCGVGGFPLEIINSNHAIKNEYMPKNNRINPKIYINGFDKGFEKEEQRTIILAKANMLIYLSELLFDNPNLTREFSTLFNNTFKLFKNNLGTFGHIIDNEEDKYDYIFTNPPYVTEGSSIIKEEIQSKEYLKKFYNINAMGLEGLSIEYIVKSLKKYGEAYIIIPDGILDRYHDKRLREFILEQCFLEALIELPVKTFYTNSKKTYILIIKKKSLNELQDYPVFTYTISNIGEKLTSVFRSEIAENDLPEMEHLYRYFNTFKQSNINIQEEIQTQSNKVNIIDIKKFRSAKFWVIKDLIPENRKCILHIPKTIDINDIQKNIELIKDQLIALEELKKNLYHNILTIDIPIVDLFDLERGRVISKEYLKNHKGEYPVYSSKTKDNGIFGYIDTFDYDCEALTWTTDGIYAGTVFYRNGKFSITNVCGIMKPKIDNQYYSNLNFEYIAYNIDLKRIARSIGNKKVMEHDIKDNNSLTVALPVNDHEKIPCKIRQQELLSIFKLKEEIINNLYKYQKELNENISIMLKNGY